MNTNYNLLIDNELYLYAIIIGSGLILGCTIYYLIRSNYTAIPPKNIEPLTNEEIEAIINQNLETVTNLNIEDLTDSDFESDLESDYFKSSDDESVLDVDINELDLFFMPNVDFDVCSIQELKFFEISSIFQKEIAEKMVTDEELMDLICYLTEAELATNWVNDFIYNVISYM